MKPKLTKKQQQVLEFIASFTNLHDISPTYREIMVGLNLSSVSAVAEHINNLVLIGALKKIPNTARSLEVVDFSYPETTHLFNLKLKTANQEEVIILEKAAHILGISIDQNLL